MVDDVLDLSQVDAGRMVLHREWVDLDTVVDGALALVRPLADRKRISLRTVVPDDLPKLYCDRVRITQVIVNLLSNAARFTEKGEIGLSVSAQDSHIVVSVRDTGPGIPAQDADSIFEPFCQGTSARWKDTGGSGLGLTISKQFVELHGGHMWLESEVGVGSTFSFRLPVSLPPTPGVAPGRWLVADWEWMERTSRALAPSTPLEPRVIICDETGEVYRSFARHSDGVEYVDSRDLDGAVRELQQCPARTVVINSSSVDGLWPMLARARERLPETPIIGCSVPATTHRALAAGAAGYLVKPITRASLLEAIAALPVEARRVLVVDDNADARELLSTLLRASDDDIEVITASDGQRALDALYSQSPDVVLLDVLMPGMDGWQVLHTKSQDESIRRIPVILVSAQDPRDLPTLSPLIVAATAEGITLSKLLRCSEHLSTLLMQPD
jgi:CheY-like chemotaxis protein